ncbi:AAA family ATPase [Pontibacter ruber]|uniref:AAA family ATPase n=1 Tax=Pontibacter ruber TaxID=1343895 RepID=A0ABW5CRR8_9BACT|nr:AAA family ATPase [Pontibacter ruber]
MARIVEMVGSPGVGKSTIFKAIQAKSKSSFNWETALEPMQQPEAGVIGKLKILFELVMYGKGYVDAVKLKQAKEASDRFVAQYSEYIDACWNNLYHRQRSSNNRLDLRFEKTAFLNRMIQKVQLLRESPNNKTVLIDMGLVNIVERGLYKSTTASEERLEIRRLLDVMPLPDAVVYIQTDAAENARRLLMRREVRDYHRSLNTEELIQCTVKWQERLNAAIDYLEEKKVPMLHVDSKNPIDENADRIIDFISKPVTPDDLKYNKQLKLVY